MTDAEQGAREAEAKLDLFLEGLAGREAIKQWLLGWSARQVEQERERCAKLADEEAEASAGVADMDGVSSAMKIAEGIRAQEQP